MPKKRGQNEGSIRQRKDGKWEARYTLGTDATGKQKQISVYGKTRKEVSEKLSGKLNEINTGTHIDESKITLYEWMWDWLFTYKKNNVRAATFQINETLVRNHIKDSEIGSIALKNLRSFHFQKFYNSKKDVLAVSTIKRLHVVVKESLDCAIDNNMIYKNPAIKLKLPQKDQKEIRILTLPEQQEFIKSVKDNKFRCAFILALQTGLRIGELLALRWSDIDKENKEINIQRSIKRVKTNYDVNSLENKTSVLISDVKTASSRRKVPLMKTALRELELHEKLQLEQKMANRKQWNEKEKDWIFTSSVGTIIETRRFSGYFAKALDDCGIKHINFHALRHTFASRMIEAGADIKTISTILGHTSVAFTMDIYGHILPKQKQDAISKINDLFEEKE